MMIDRIFSFGSALLFAQFPQFYIQYIHELNGHVKELQYQVKQIEQAAKLSNKSLAEWVHKFQVNIDPDISLQGNLLNEIVIRLNSFQEALTALEASSPFLKPFTFMQFANKQVFYDTASSFEFGFTFTGETFFYVLLGMFFGHLICSKNLLGLLPRRLID